MNTLLIPLIGPMQSWGSRSRFDDRDTNMAPTKSAVLGLICSALGRQREEPMDDLTALRFGVRVDEPGRPFTDFQTAQDVVHADGKNKSTVTSTRHYLAGARFLAGLESENIGLLAEIETALRSPRYTLSLGRKSYPLSLPPYFPDGSIRKNVTLEEALRREAWRYFTNMEAARRPKKLTILCETADGSAVITDQPLDFSTRVFALRRISIVDVDMPEEVTQWFTYPN